MVGACAVARSDDHCGGVDFANLQCVGYVENMPVGKSFALQYERFAMYLPVGVLKRVDVDGSRDAPRSALEAAIGPIDRGHPTADDVASGASAENGVKCQPQNDHHRCDGDKRMFSVVFHLVVNNAVPLGLLLWAKTLFWATLRRWLHGRQLGEGSSPVKRWCFGVCFRVPDAPCAT